MLLAKKGRGRIGVRPVVVLVRRLRILAREHEVVAVGAPAARGGALGINLLCAGSAADDADIGMLCAPDKRTVDLDLEP